MTTLLVTLVLILAAAVLIQWRLLRRSYAREATMRDELSVRLRVAEQKLAYVTPLRAKGAK